MIAKGAEEGDLPKTDIAVNHSRCELLQCVMNGQLPARLGNNTGGGLGKSYPTRLSKVNLDLVCQAPTLVS